MKNLIYNLAIFILLAIAFSSFAACTKSDTDATAAVNSAANASESKTDYPPVPAAIMQANLTKLDGTNFKLEDYKGKVVLVNLWATWCGPCKAEMPELIKLKDAQKDKGFEIVGLDSDQEDTTEAIAAFREKMNLNYELAKSDDKLFGEFLKISRFNGIPQSFLIDRDGRLNGVFAGANPNTVAKIKDLVEKLTQ